MPLAGPQDDYRRAHDLLAHYYRPQALETAIPLLEKIVAQDAQFAPAFADLARANFLQFTQQRDTKYIEPARESALRALALAPDLASAHVTLGALYARTAQNDLARHELDEALRLDRFNAAAYGALADLYARQGRSELVEPTLQKAVSLAPDDWSLVQQLGEHYLDNGKWARAGEQYRHAAELTPDNPRAHNNLGLVYRGLDRLEQSAAAFQKAIDLEPTFLRFRNLGMVLAEAGRYSEASQMLKRSIEMRPDHYRAWGFLAFVYLNQHADQAKVRETFLKAIALAADLRRKPRGMSICWPTSAVITRPSGWKKRVCRCSRRRRPSRRTFRKCSIRLRSGTRRFIAASRRCIGLQRRERVAILPRPSCGIPSWPRFAPTRGTARPCAGSLAPRKRGDDSMLSQSVPSSSGGAFPSFATVNPTWYMSNPNVDRSVPPRPAKKKAAKKKPATKTPGRDDDNGLRSHGVGSPAPWLTPPSPRTRAQPALRRRDADNLLTSRPRAAEVTTRMRW